MFEAAGVGTVEPGIWMLCMGPVVSGGHMEHRLQWGREGECS